MSTRSLLDDTRQMTRAIRMIELGARLQMLQSETALPYERLLKLYKEVTGKSPSKGQLPFSADWFMTWQPNIHASLFFNIYTYLQKTTALDDGDAIVKAYELYLADVGTHGIAPLLSITRAWRLVRFVDNGLVTMNQCTRCRGRFINHCFDLEDRFVCGLCDPPARAGKARRAGAIH